MKAAPNNPLGHFEDEAFVNVNESILRALGRTWDNPPPEHDYWVEAVRVNSDICRAADALKLEFASRRLWGWKDPRNCITLPFWRSVLGEMKVVICLRHPVEVRESLRSRNGFPSEKCIQLWTTHNQRLMRDVTLEARLVCHLESFHKHPEREIRRILRFLGSEVSDQSLESGSAAITKNLRHHEVAWNDLSSVGPIEGALYQEMCAEAELT